MPVDDGAIHPLDRMPLELLAKRALGGRRLRKHDETRGITIDAVHDERLALALRPQMRDELIDDRVLVLFALERHGEEAGRLVEHDQDFVFVENMQVARARRRPAARASRPIHPHADAIAAPELRGGRLGRGLDVVDEPLAAIGHAWRGMTNGKQSDEEVVRAYKQRGYAVAGVSNYASIAAFRGVDTMPLYEHGYNIMKAHQLAIGARRVVWLDFPFWQTLDQKQLIIDRVGAAADLVSLNHPNTGYVDDDMRNLTGYQLMEIVNGPFPVEDLWDFAR